MRHGSTVGHGGAELASHTDRHPRDPVAAPAM